MFDFIPLEYYFRVYIHIAFFVVVFTLLHTYALSINDRKNINYINIIGYLFLFYAILYIGFRPVSGRFFGDMSTYNVKYLRYVNGEPLNTKQDVFFEIYMKICSQFLTVKYFFLLCAIAYILPFYKVSIFFFGKYWLYAFLMFAVSFSFWTYGTNGIRNGMATSFFLWGVSLYNKKFWMIVVFIISTQIHNSLMLPIMAFLISHTYSNSKSYFIFWLFSIPLSLAFGGIWENLFASLGFGNDRLSGYISGTQLDDAGIVTSGFRYDFLFYSAVAVFVGWYFIFKKDFYDKVYFHLYNTYLICNGFWILVIRANFSNRFAYLSWFLMGLIIIYPFLKGSFFNNQHIVIGKVLTAYFSFTYFMYYVYY
ncbi:EpsG family protein [Tamlana fucoidanivorans]|uniref:EpsG family protein n=1 Tax=Allotamlana fucoidanivorans TaxID=2583814 RepID=A0A5C4SQD1_9FLAO|nr:EpsG family protein [Tamlana fucoidanivorans]TNJ46465.1 EpsG family protein [Tamlana fucoidanivorans]